VNTAERELIERRWNELEAERASGERRVRVADLPVDTVNGPLAVAVDHDGHRHVLVPIPSRQKVRGGLDGPVLRLRKRVLEDEDTYQTYADLGCLHADVDDLFTILCAEVLQTTRALPDNPIKALYRVLDRWKALFRPHSTPLGIEQVAGLFGELTVLIRLLEEDPSAHSLWRGPSGHHHDFSTGIAAVEVKASTGGEGRHLRIHGLDQLETPPRGTLRVASYRLERHAGSGRDLVELVERALHLCDDERAVLELLARAGYHSADSDHYRDIRFSVAEERWYAVDAAFPKLTSNDLATAGIPIAVLDVAYTIDLSTEPPNPIGQDRVTEYLTSMLRESA
jgi:hypothetical protein